MARPIRNKLEFTNDSLKQMLEQLHNQAEDLRLSSMRDYKEIKQLTNNGTKEAIAANVVNLETARNNSLRTVREAISQRTDLVKVQAGVIIALAKQVDTVDPNAPAPTDELPKDLKATLRQMANEVRKARENEG